MHIPLLSKTPKRQQHCLVVCEDRFLQNVVLPIETIYITDEEASKAWQLVHRWMLPMQNSKHLYQVLGERDAVPLYPFSVDGQDEPSDVDAIAREEFFKHLGELEKQGKKNLIASAIKFAILVISVLFALIVLLYMYQSGFQMPSFW